MAAHLMKPTVWIFSLEPISTRYTQQWHEHIPQLLNGIGLKFKVVQIDGVQKDSEPTPGAFLNFSDTNYWKSSQLCKFLEHFNKGETSSNDHILITDAWNPAIIQLKYMNDLLGYNWKIHALWHAGSYDPHDFLGRACGDRAWVRHAEKSFFHAIDHNYFATDFHIDMFCNNLFECRTRDITDFNTGKVVRSGWPMEYMDSALTAYKNMPKRDLIVFPHRIAPEKQVEIFRDLKNYLPEFDFVVCQDQKLTKHQYHTILGEAKIVFSASLQETLGIGCYEGAIVDAMPIVPDRLSYSEMYDNLWKYPSQWTENWASYLHHRTELVAHIRVMMKNYENYLPRLAEQTLQLRENFFSAGELLIRVQ